MTPGYVLFRVGERSFAFSLSETREIVRLTGIERLPGTRPPLVGVIMLRGTPLPVLDLRGANAADDHGDVLVMEVNGDLVGIAVDAVLAVLAAKDLPEADEAPAKALPSYVIGLRRSASGPVLLVDLQRMLDIVAEGWSDSLPGSGSILAS
ncbi:MAG TPA: chemotaxis protein CheW [Mycobacteriales bacterium]|nr:chemotaxis protein CheW [Mycobacteriales bacterium]